MRAFILCSQTLGRLRRVLYHHGGSVTLRELGRRYDIWPWEVEQAAENGWVRIETRKPRVGRPSRIVHQVSFSHPAKRVPHRSSLPKIISHRHNRFAWRTVQHTVRRGSRYLGLSIPGNVAAYLATYPGAKSRNGAAASCSRLLKHPDVIALRQWFYSTYNGEIPWEPTPDTAREIWQRLHAHGSWRMSWAPWQERHRLTKAEQQPSR